MWNFYSLSLITQKRYRWGDVNGKCVLSTKLRTIFKHVQSPHNKVAEKMTKFSQIHMNYKHSLAHSNMKKRNMVIHGHTVFTARSCSLDK